MIEFKKYENKKKIERIMKSTTNTILLKVSHDIPKADLKAEFKKQL